MSTEPTNPLLPKRMTKRSLIVTGAVVVAVGVGAVFGVGALRDYRAGIEASEQSAEAYYTAAAEQSQQADEAAERAQAAADSAAEAVTAAEAEEAAAAAVAEAEAAAAAAAAANVSQGLTADGKCPAGTVAGEVRADGTEGLCSPKGPQGQTCAEYTDNVCTGWLKP